MLLRGAAVVLVWPALAAAVLQAQTVEDDVVVENQSPRATRTGFSGWWQNQVDMNRARQRAWGRNLPYTESELAAADDVVVVGQQPPQPAAAAPASKAPAAAHHNGGPTRPSSGTPAQPVTITTRKTVPAYATPFNAPGPPGYVPPGYAAVNAPLYPCPKPGIPLETGATIITNPALYPHEMLYPHEYRAMYGPFYTQNRRSWIMTPFGIYKREKRCLTGTEVHVKYKSYIGPFSLYLPPTCNTSAYPVGKNPAPW
jgi:hypothetical protein